MKKNSKQTIHNRYHEYLSFLKDKSETFMHRNPEYYLKRYKLFKSVIDQVPCGIFILNFQTRKYLFVSEYARKIIGFAPSELMSVTLDWSLSRIHPEDFAIYSNDIFKKFLEYSHSASYEDINDIKFSLNYRYKRKDGLYIKLLQQYCILERDSGNNPILVLGIFTDITAYKTDNKVTFSITKFNKDVGYDIVMFSDAFVPENFKLTSREIEVLKLIKAGFTSKKIGEKLFVSENTVRAHRRNIFEKTNCHNVAQLSDFATVNGFL